MAHRPSLWQMYRPNFCSECGAKIFRLHWRLWSSRRFCDDCAARLRKERFSTPVVAAVVLLCIGLVAGRAGRPAPPPLIIERQASSPFFNDDANNSEVEIKSDESQAPGKESSSDSHGQGQLSESSMADDMAYTCGARTKKGTPCSRRVYGPVRCWQHKGKPAMLPQEKLKLSDKL